ncbi:ABC transporter substrate-binding protein [Brevibacillus dissolubilis]|uniref:ABC transporter substrate-binding protein n=1 Tax=Brevibacillus dissolubilis TaxID=1844116 RepID=UPI0011169381|nr:ABC transporter substrate-binding protein [Brevibacillus dissolubilis]
MCRGSLSKIMLCIVMVSMIILTGCTDEGQPEPNSSTTADSTITTQQNQNPQATSPDTAATQGRELVIGSPVALPALDPLGLSKQEPLLTDYERFTYHSLFTLHENGLLAPELAFDSQIHSEANPPSLTLTLRNGAKWSDGQPVTLDDIAFTYQLYARTDYYGVWKTGIHLLQGVSEYRKGKTPDISGIKLDAAKGTATFTFTRSDASSIQIFTAPLLPKHQLDGKNLAQIADLAKQGSLIGAGPFQVKSWGQQDAQFIANPNYYHGQPQLASVRIVPVAEDRVAEEIRQGRIHVTAVSPDLASQLASGTQGAHVQTSAGSGYHYLGFNTQSDKVKDRAIRQALAQAVPVGEIAKTAFHGFAVPVKSPISSPSIFYKAGNFPAYDLQFAQKILVDKGYTQEKPLALTLVYPGDNPVRERILDAVLQSWKALPVQIERKALPPAEFTAYLFGGQPADLFLYAWKYPQDPSELREMWHSQEKVGELGLNASRYHNPKADTLLDQGKSTLATKIRQGYYAQWQELWAADLPILPLVEIQETYYVSDQVNGMKDKAGQNPYENVNEWTLR